MQKKETFRDAIFIIVAEEACPFYSVGEEIKIESSGLSMSTYKPSCLHLVQTIASIVSAEESVDASAEQSTHKSRYHCDGCQGKVEFVYKRDKDFSTLQMKLLQEGEEKRRKEQIEKYFGIMRQLELFKPLEDAALEDLIMLLEFKTFPRGKVVVEKGTPGNNFFIVLQGHVKRKDDDGTKLANIKAGEVFGAMSLLSTEPFTHSIYSVTATHIAILSVKNFKEILHKFPVLQMFLFKLLVDQAQAVALKAGNISSRMTGELAEVGAVDLLQLINSSRKTGCLDIALEKGRGMIFFKEGEIIYARYQKLRGQQVIHELLGIKKGHFSYTKGIPEMFDKVPPIGEFMSIIMEGLQKIDENTET